MKNNYLLKAADLVVFSILAYLAAQYYVVNSNMFDAINIGALAYVMIRRPDINTVTLTLLILAGRLIDSVLLYDMQQVGGYIAYPVLFLFNVVAIVLIWFRPLLVSKYGVGRMRNHKELAVTHQDIVIGFLFTLQAIFQLLAFIEHLSRHLDDIGLAQVLDANWWYENSRIIYNHYEEIQFLFAVLGLLILYFMTFDSSKIKREDRKKFREQDISII